MQCRMHGTSAPIRRRSAVRWEATTYHASRLIKSLHKTPPEHHRNNILPKGLRDAPRGMQAPSPRTANNKKRSPPKRGVEDIYIHTYIYIHVYINICTYIFIYMHVECLEEEGILTCSNGQFLPCTQANNCSNSYSFKPKSDCIK